MTVKERIAALRARMKETGIDAYLIPTDDFHGSEYVGEFFKCRKYITGLTGSAGTAVIMQDMAGLWTDGRYFIQAADQLEGTGITLFKKGEPEVPTVHEFLKKNLTFCIGFRKKMFYTIFCIFIPKETSACPPCRCDFCLTAPLLSSAE